MKEKIAYIFCVLDGLLCLLFMVSAIKENNTATYGIAALTSVGMWVMYSIGFIVTLIIFIVLIVLLIYKHTKKR